MTKFFLPTLAVLALTLAAQQTASAVDLPKAPPVSQFAPAEDIIAKLDYYVERVLDDVADPEEYADSQAKVKKDADTIAALALALGLHDQDNKYKAAAPAIIAAANKIAAATEFAAAKAAGDELSAALTSKGDPSSLKWQKVASLKELMEQVPLINSSLKRGLRRFEREAEDIGVDAAALAVLAQASMANYDETDNPNAADQWFAFCAAMRDAAAKINKAAHEGNEDAVNAAVEEMTKACDDCHAVFHKEE